MTLQPGCAAGDPIEESLAADVATAILGVDTLFGGDVMNPSGTGRFIADSWFSDAELPPAYSHDTAAAVRSSGGVSAKAPDAAAIDRYLAAVDVRGAISRVDSAGKSLGGLRGEYLESLARCFSVMADLVEEILGRGAAVSHERCVVASTGKPPEPSDPASKRARVIELLAKIGHSPHDGRVLEAVDDWRRERLVPRKALPGIAGACIAELDAHTVQNLLRHLPDELEGVPRANVRFLPIENAWFSGSMNYLGRARTEDGAPLYDATYELNAALEISWPEFVQLVSHEVVPGHVTTFAYLQNLFVRGRVGFEGSILTMNTRAAALFEGIANNAILIAHGVTEVDDLPDDDLKLGVYLALLQDDAKNQSSWSTWTEGKPQAEVAAALRRDFLVSEERADKLSGAWGRHPLLGRMYLPAYRAGTEKVAELRRKHPPESVLPALYGWKGLLDVVTIEKALAA